MTTSELRYAEVGEEKERTMFMTMRAILGLAACLITSGCAGLDSADDRPNDASIIPLEFHAVWVFDPSVCGRPQPYPFIRLEGDGFSTSEPPYSKEPNSFAFRRIVVDRSNRRHLVATLPSAGTPRETSEVKLELSADGKTMRWLEKQATKSVTLFRCD
jgi:hypothetical protein